MSDKIRLKASAGTDEANQGTRRFRVDPNTQEVEVDADAAPALIERGGFEPVEKLALPTPRGFVRVRHSDPDAQLSWGGETYDQDPDGSFLVPGAAAKYLSAHGFVADEA